MTRVAKAPGHPSRELSWSDSDAKFSDCARQARIDPAIAARALGILHDLENCPDMSLLIQNLHH